MIPVHNNLVFKPENFNTSSEPGITIILRNQEFLTSKASEILVFEDEDEYFNSFVMFIVQ